MKTRSAAPTRPRSDAGVRSGPSVDRMNTLTMSLAARKDSATKLRMKFSERPKMMVNSPNSATQASSTGPTLRWIGRTDSRMPTSTAPTPGAARSTP